MLVWTLVNHLRSKQMELASSLIEIERTEERLLIEEKLAAVGRLSSAIAHEIRNPVAMIASALKTAGGHPLDSEESREMFEIASKEATRLERLTTDFLTYAKPRAPAKQRNDLADSIAYIAGLCRPRAAETGVNVRSEGPEGFLSVSAEIGPADFPLALTDEKAGGGTDEALQWIDSMPESVNLKEILEETERTFIARALRLSGGIQAEAGRRLQLSRSDLGYKLAKYRLRTDGE